MNKTLSLEDKNKKMRNILEQNAIAIFENIEFGEKIFLVRNLLGNRLLYIYCITKDGNFRSDLNKIYLRYMQNEMKMTKMPNSIYHLWHICMCKDCKKLGGRIFSHSQGDWSSHLRFVKNKDIFDFRTLKTLKN